MNIKDNVAIVTGASGGIGEATARELARQGATVVLAARRVDQIEQIRAEIERGGGHALAVPTDVSQRSEIDRLVQATIDHYGRIDILVNNAGIGEGSSVVTSSDADMQHIVGVNLLGPARLIQAVLPHMQKHGSGVIVNIGSVAGEIATSGLYSATKFGLRGLTDALRREVQREGIACVLVEPGFVRTDMTHNVKLPMPGPDLIARIIADAVRRPRRTIIVPWYYRPLAMIAQLFPGLVDVAISAKGFLYSHRTYT